jgi:hypothetical protein
VHGQEEEIPQTMYAYVNKWIIIKNGVSYIGNVFFFFLKIFFSSALIYKPFTWWFSLSLCITPNISILLQSIIIALFSTTIELYLSTLGSCLPAAFTLHTTSSQPPSSFFLISSPAPIIYTS